MTSMVSPVIRKSSLPPRWPGTELVAPTVPFPSRMSRVRIPSPAPLPLRFQRRTLTVAARVVLSAVLAVGAFDLSDPRRSASGRRRRSSEKVGPRPLKPGVIDPSLGVGSAIGAAQWTGMDHADEHPTSVAHLGGPIGLGRTAEVFARGDDEAVKLLRPGIPEVVGEREASVAALVDRAGIGAPRFGGTTRIDGRLALVYERLDGPSMLDRCRATRSRSTGWPGSSPDCTSPCTTPTARGCPTRRRRCAG